MLQDPCPGKLHMLEKLAELHAHWDPKQSTLLLQPLSIARWRRKISKGLRSTFIKQEKRMDMELKGNKSIIAVEQKEKTNYIQEWRIMKSDNTRISPDHNKHMFGLCYTDRRWH